MQVLIEILPIHFFNATRFPIGILSAVIFRVPAFEFTDHRYDAGRKFIVSIVEASPSSNGALSSAVFQFEMIQTPMPHFGSQFILGREKERQTNKNTHKMNALVVGPAFTFNLLVKFRQQSALNT